MNKWIDEQLKKGYIHPSQSPQVSPFFYVAKKEKGEHLSNKEEMREHIKHVLQWLKENDLFLKLEKCKFVAKEVEFLGMIVKEGKIMMDPVKLAGISKWPEPKTVKQVRSFLGFAGFYRKFIGNYAEIMAPLTNLTKKLVPFRWDAECQKAFDTAKEKFLEEPVLVMPDPVKPFILETDASNWAAGAVLKQRGSDGELHPCGYISHRLSDAEQKYQVYDRELLAIKKAFETWRHLLKGSPHTIIIHCDHKNLSYYKHPQKMTARQSRWWQEISEFDIKLEHVPGSKLIQADALSRRPDHINEEEAKAKEIPQTMIPKDMVIAVLNTSWSDQITELIPNDKFANVIINGLKHGKMPIRSKFTDWKIDDGIIRHQGRIYVPQNEELRHDIIKSHHDPVVMGHPGRLKTLELIRRDYYWPGMTTTVSKWVEGCALCQQMKVNTHPTAPGLMPIKSHATRPFEQVSMDFITDLPPVDGFDSVLTVVDQGLTKGVIFIPCKKTFTAMDTANSYINDVYKRFGLPTTLISDRGPQFSSKVFQEICKIFGINHRMSTVFHPQTDGESE